MAESTLALLAKQINPATRSMDPIHSRELTNQNRFRTPCQRVDTIKRDR